MFDLKSMIQAKNTNCRLIDFTIYILLFVCTTYLEKVEIKIILLLLFSGHSQDESQSDGPEIEQAPVQPQ